MSESLDVDARVANYLIEQAHLHDATDTKSATNPPEVTWSDSEHCPEFQLVPMLLSHSSRDGRVLTGVAVLQVEPGASLRNAGALAADGLSQAFHESGDSTAHTRSGTSRDGSTAGEDLPEVEKAGEAQKRVEEIILRLPPSCELSQSLLRAQVAQQRCAS